MLTSTSGPSPTWGTSGRTIKTTSNDQRRTKSAEGNRIGSAAIRQSWCLSTRVAIVLFLLSQSSLVFKATCAGLNNNNNIISSSSSISNDSQEAKLGAKTGIGGGALAQESMDFLLKDTMRLLDSLDQKVTSMDNKLPSTMLLRGKLAEPDGAQESSREKQQQEQQFSFGERNLSSADSDEATSSDEGLIEEALVKLAEEFAASRQPSESDDLLAESMAMTASNSQSPVNRNESTLLGRNNSTDSSLEDSQQSSSSASLSSTIQKQQQAANPRKPVGLGGNGPNGGQRGAVHEVFKRAKQLHTASSHQSASIASDTESNQLASDSTERHIKFTLDLMQSIFSSQSYSAKTNQIESFLISPLSIQMVLMLMHLGARGQTRREISNCLHLTTTIQPSAHTSSSSGSGNPLDKALQTQASSYHYANHQHHQHGNNNNNNHHQHSLHNSDLSSGADAATGASKLKRRQQQQQASSDKQQQQSVSGGAKPQSTSSAPPVSSRSRQHSSANSVPVSSNTASNAHELFGGAMRNLLKDPIVMKALTSANQIFLQKNLPLSAQYEWAIKHYYAADVKLVDFQHQSSGSTAALSASSQTLTANPSSAHLTSEKGTQNGANADHPSTSLAATNFTSLSEQKRNSRAATAANDESQANNIQQMVNDWVGKQTKGRISEFLASPVSTSTLMMAINVLYFKGDWQYKFDPFDTQTEALFTQASGKQTKIPMMVNRLPLAFAHDPQMKTSVIELPYKAQRLGLFLLLPDEVSGIFHTMQMLNSTSFANLISSMRKPSPTADQAASGINVRIPKFSIDSSPRLSQILSEQLGLRTLFTPELADLSGMFTPFKRGLYFNATLGGQHKLGSTDHGDFHLVHDLPDHGLGGPLQVGLDELLHKAVLQVDEQGSVAAASSATILERVGVSNSNYFEADHPFLLFLMDKQTGLVLFSGAFAGGNSTDSATTNNSQEAAQQKQQH